MIGVKQAVDAAINDIRQFSDLMPTAGLRLEETELDDAGWHTSHGRGGEALELLRNSMRGFVEREPNARGAAPAEPQATLL
jgi:hypothetical protein